MSLCCDTSGSGLLALFPVVWEVENPALETQACAQTPLEKEDGYGGQLGVLVDLPWFLIMNPRESEPQNCS